MRFEMNFNEEQIIRLEKLSLRNYVCELVEHCMSLFPLLVSLQGQDSFRAYIEQLIIIAKKDGYTQRGPVRLYIDMMIIFGVRFGNDPLYQSFTIKKQEMNLSQIEKSMILYSYLSEYMEFVYGKNNLLFKESIKKFQNLDIKNVLANVEANYGGVHNLLKNIYPQKYFFVGSSSINNLIKSSDELAKCYGLGKFNQKIYLTLIMFLFGCSFEQGIFRNVISMDYFSRSFASEDAEFHHSIVSCYECLQINIVDS